MADKQIRTVTLDEREQGRRRGSLWAYGYATLAAIFALAPLALATGEGAAMLQPLAVAMDGGICHHHLGVEQRTRRQLPVKEAAMAVRPVHHGRNGKDFLFVFQ